MTECRVDFSDAFASFVMENLHNDLYLFSSLWIDIDIDIADSLTPTGSCKLRQACCSSKVVMYEVRVSTSSSISSAIELIECAKSFLALHVNLMPEEFLRIVSVNLALNMQ